MKFIKESFPKNILFLALVALIASWGLFFPLPASAGLITTVLLALPGVVLAIIGFFTNLFAQLAIILFNFVTSPSFISLPYTKAGPLPDGNPIIEAGLNITKNFVNLSLVAAIVFIALAITLRLEEYATRKTLVRLIFIALLVNFAPVICGLIVDASNIVMNYFLSAIQDGVADLFSNIKNSFSTFSSMLNPIGKKPGDQLAQFGMLGASIALDAAVSFTFFTLAAIFIVRYIAIWILVILSPLAFVAWILPATKKIWDMWWKQLLNWSFIGIPLAFFVYLAISSFAVINVSFKNKITMPGLASEIKETVGYFNDFFAYPMIIVIIWIGIFVGLQSSAMGSSAVVNFTKRSGGWVGKKAWRGMKLGDRKIVPKILSKDEEGKRRLLQLTTARDVSGTITKKWESKPFLRWFVPEPLRRFSEFRSAIEAEKKNITGKTEDEIRRVDNGTYVGTKAAAAIDSIIRDRGDSHDIIKYYMEKYKVKTEEDLLENEKFLKDSRLLNAIEFIAKAGNRGKIERIDPRLAKIGRSAERGQEAMIDAITNAKAGDVAIWEREVAENEEVMEAALSIGDDDFFRAMGRLKGKVRARQTTIDKVFSNWIDKQGLDNTKNKENWKKFTEYLGKKYNVLTPGIKKALSNPRFQSAGWGYIDELDSGARYISEEERKTSLGTTPGAGESKIDKIKKEVEETRKLNKPLSPWQAAVEKQEKKRLETIDQAMKRKREEKKKK